MPKIDKMPGLQTIRAMAGTLDYYVLRGQPCVRSWPRWDRDMLTPAMQQAIDDFKATNQLIHAIAAEIRLAATDDAAGTGWTWHDLLQVVAAGGKMTSDSFPYGLVLTYQDAPNTQEIPSGVWTPRQTNTPPPIDVEELWSLSNPNQFTLEYDGFYVAFGWANWEGVGMNTLGVGIAVNNAIQNGVTITAGPPAGGAQFGTWGFFFAAAGAAVQLQLLQTSGHPIHIFGSQLALIRIG